MTVKRVRIITAAGAVIAVGAVLVLVPGLTGRATGGCGGYYAPPPDTEEEEESGIANLSTLSGSAQTLTQNTNDIVPPINVYWGWTDRNHIEVRFQCGNYADSHAIQVCAGGYGDCDYDEDGALRNQSSRSVWNTVLQTAECPPYSSGAPPVVTVQVPVYWPTVLEVATDIQANTLPGCVRVRGLNTRDAGYNLRPQCQAKNMNDRTDPAPYGVSWVWTSHTDIDLTFSCANLGNRHFIEHCEGSYSQCEYADANGNTWDSQLDWTVIETVDSPCPRRPEDPPRDVTITVDGWVDEPGCLRVSTENLDNPRDGSQDDHRNWKANCNRKNGTPDRPAPGGTPTPPPPPPNCQGSGQSCSATPDTCCRGLRCDPNAGSVCVGCKERGETGCNDTWCCYYPRSWDPGTYITCQENQCCPLIGGCP